LNKDITDMLKRKIEETLRKWKSSENKKPLVLKGCRQCGKTYSVMKFAKENYENVVYVNFMTNEKYNSAFSGSLEVDDIITGLSALTSSTTFRPGNTCIVFDEIQESPRARTSLKSFCIDGRYDVIATGSLLGVRGYGKHKDSKASVPVGYETIVTMYPLDFEEFLWANGMPENIIALVKKSLDDIAPVQEAVHIKMAELILKYTVVGGMPEVVQTFVNTHDMGQVRALQTNIVAGYEEDMVKYANDQDKSRIRECFESIPKQLSKENKKFQYSAVKKGARPRILSQAYNG